MSDFTKGEWKIIRDTGLTGVIGIEADGEPIAGINSRIREAEANAHLIKAAPRMYEALKVLVAAEFGVIEKHKIDKALIALAEAEVK